MDIQDQCKKIMLQSVVFFPPTTKQKVLHDLVASLVDPSFQELCLQHILDREERASTAIGKKIALPHACVEGIEDFLIGVGLSPKDAIGDWETLDFEPLQIVVMILAPPQQKREYLELLSNLSKKMSKKSFTDALLQAVHAEDVVKIFHS